jgi:hypothetical protein
MSFLRDALTDWMIEMQEPRHQVVVSNCQNWLLGIVAALFGEANYDQMGLPTIEYTPKN